MKINQKQFKEILWNNNSFEVVERSEKLIHFHIPQLSLGQLPNTETGPVILDSVNLCFHKPRIRAFMLWDYNSESWISHTDEEFPIGQQIKEAFCKKPGSRYILSFKGEHELGLGCWGFTAESIDLKWAKYKNKD